MPTPIDVDSVCTDQDLADHVGGMGALLALVRDDAGWLNADETNKTTRPARAQVLGDILQELRKRRPPIRDYDIIYHVELKYAVVCGSLALLYQGAAENIDSPKLKLAGMWSARFSSEKTSVQPEVRQGATSSSLGVRISRG